MNSLLLLVLLCAAVVGPATASCQQSNLKTCASLGSAAECTTEACTCGDTATTKTASDSYKDCWICTPNCELEKKIDNNNLLDTHTSTLTTCACPLEYTKTSTVTTSGKGHYCKGRTFIATVDTQRCNGFLCATDGKCLSSCSKVNDGTKDCSDGSDEGGTVSAPTPPPTPPPTKTPTTTTSGTSGTSTKAQAYTSMSAPSGGGVCTCNGHLKATVSGSTKAACAGVASWMDSSGTTGNACSLCDCGGGGSCNCGFVKSSTVASSPTPAASPAEDSGMSGGAIFGIIVLVLVLVAGAAVAGLFFTKKGPFEPKDGDLYTDK